MTMQPFTRLTLSSGRVWHVLPSRMVGSSCSDSPCELGVLSVPPLWEAMVAAPLGSRDRRVQEESQEAETFFSQPKGAPAEQGS